VLSLAISSQRIGILRKGSNNDTRRRTGKNIIGFTLSSHAPDGRFSSIELILDFTLRTEQWKQHEYVE
jgi:hypothetical protein